MSPGRQDPSGQSNQMRRPATETKRSPFVVRKSLGKPLARKLRPRRRLPVHFVSRSRGRSSGRRRTGRVVGRDKCGSLLSVASQRRVRRRRRLRGSHLSSLSFRTREITTPIGRSPWTRARWTGRAGPTWTTRSSAGVGNGRLANTITARSRALAWTTRTPKDRCVGRSRPREERFVFFFPNLATHPLRHLSLDRPPV